MKMTRFEWRKIWGNRSFLVCLAILLFANVFLLSFSNNNDYISSAAYREIGQDLAQYSLFEEKEAFVSAEIEKVQGLYLLEEYFYQMSMGGKPYKPHYQDAFDQYLELYQSKEYGLYNETLAQDYALLAEIELELRTVNEYDRFIESIEKEAEKISSISIFNQGESFFTSQNLKKTVKAYQHLQGVEISYFPQKGITTALSYATTDIMLVILMVLIAVFLIREEIDSGMLQLIHTTKNGRGKTAVAKMMALCFALLVVVILLYGMNLAYCAYRYGLGDLMRPVQSVPAFIRCVLPIRLWQYILLFLFVKWVAACVVGILMMLVMYLAKNVFWGSFISFAVVAGQWVIREIIPATSKIHIVKYVNLVSFLTTNELLGVYRNLNFFGRPANIMAVEFLSLFVIFLIGVVLFVSVFSGINKQSASVKRFAFPYRRKYTSVLREEVHKTFVVNFALVFVVLGFALQGYQAFTEPSIITVEEQYYRQYMNLLNGPYNEETYTKMQLANEEFAEKRELSWRYGMGFISQAEYQSKQNPALDIKQQVFEQKVIPKYNEVVNTPYAEFVYESGYYKLFDVNDKQDLKETLYIGFLVSLCFAGIFAVEKQSGMYKLIITTKHGRETTFSAKYKVSIMLSFFIALSSCLPRMARVSLEYGLPSLSAPLRSLTIYQNTPSFLLLVMVIVVWFLCRVYVCFTLGSLVMAISQKIGKILPSIMVSFVLLCTPLLLSMLGFGVFRFLSFYPIIHFIADLSSLPDTLYNVAFIAFSYVVNSCCFQYLSSSYKIPAKK